MALWKIKINTKILYTIQSAVKRTKKKHKKNRGLEMLY